MSTPDEPTSVPSLAGFNAVVMGPSGTGKTYSLGTLVDTGIEVFVLFLENGLESLLGYWTDRGLPVPENLHWHILDAPKASFKELRSAAVKVNTLNLESLAKMADPDRGKHNRFITMLEALDDFPDDRTGKKFGAVDSWGTGRALAIDGLTGVNNAAMSMVVGGKPVRSQADWGIAQDQVEKILRMLCDNCPCHFVILAHVEKEVDTLLGGVKLTISTLGNKLAPKLTPMFSDVILSVRETDKFTWDTANSMADLKSRNLSIKSQQAPSFAPIVAKWKKRGGGV